MSSGSALFAKVSVLVCRDERVKVLFLCIYNLFLLAFTVERIDWVEEVVLLERKEMSQLKNNVIFHRSRNIEFQREGKLIVSGFQIYGICNVSF